MNTTKDTFTKEFLAKINGKILKEVELISDKRYTRVRLAVSSQEDECTEIAILPGDLMIPGLIGVVRPEDILKLEFYETGQEMLEVIASFDLKPPSYLLEQLISDMATIKRKQKFDEELSAFLGKDVIKRLSAALWLIDDPKVKERFAGPPE